MPFTIQCYRILKQSKYKIFFQYHVEVINRIKELNKEHRSWDSVEKCWVLHTKGLYELIKRYRNSDKILFDFGGVNEKKEFIKQIQKIDADEIEKEKTIKILNKKKDKWIKLKDQLDTNYKKYSDLCHKNLKKGVQLYPHQIAGAVFINEVKNVLLALEMGLGKTLSSIAYVEMNEFDKVFVLTPNSLKFNFYNEVLKFTNSKAHIITSKSSKYKNEYSIEESKYIIVNYEYFNPRDKKKFDEKFKSLNIKKIDALICDESQALKNTTSNTFKNFKRVFKKSFFTNEIESKVFLSGTPAPNRAHELYSVLNQISPIDFATKTHFYEYYCGMKYDDYGWSTNYDNQKLEELFHKISPYVYRKRKQDVLTDLPDKIYQKIILELSPSERKIYDDIERNVVDELNNTAPNLAITTMLKLRQYTSSLKFKYIKEIVDDLIDNNEKIVIVDTFKESLYEIYENYKEISVIHTGDQSVEDRANSVNEFQDLLSKILFFLASIQTANYGLTLTASSIMFILSLPFSVGQFDQVADRCHRIGQKSVVNIFIPIFKDTLDEYVFDVIESKRKEIMKAIDNEDYESNISESVSSDIVAKLQNKYK